MALMSRTGRQLGGEAMRLLPSIATMLSGGVQSAANGAVDLSNADPVSVQYLLPSVRAQLLSARYDLRMTSPFCASRVLHHCTAPTAGCRPGVEHPMQMVRYRQCQYTLHCKHLSQSPQAAGAVLP